MALEEVRSETAEALMQRADELEGKDAYWETTAKLMIRSDQKHLTEQAVGRAIVGWLPDAELNERQQALVQDILDAEYAHYDDNSTGLDGETARAVLRDNLYMYPLDAEVEARNAARAND